MLCHLFYCNLTVYNINNQTFLFVQIQCTITEYLCSVKLKKTFIMGLLDFLFMSSVMNNSSNRMSSSSSHSSNYRSSSYDAGYEDGYEDSCMDHDCDSYESSFNCDCDSRDYDYDSDCDCDCGDW